MNTYYYYDTPDGKDCFHKMWYTTKYSTMAGLVASVYDIILVAQPKGYFQGIARVAYWAGPAAAVGVTFSAISCAAINLRNKDDKWNYALAGACSGALWGASRKNFALGCICAAFGTLGAVLVKFAHDEQWRRVFPEKHIARDFGLYDQYKRDYTLFRDPKDLK